MRIFFSILFSAFCISVYGQDVISITESSAHIYSGSIGNYQVRMNLYITGNKVSGQFTYSNDGPAVDISGALDGNLLNLQESYQKLIWGDVKADDYLLKGNIKATINKNGDISGGVSVAGSNGANSIALHQVYSLQYVDSMLTADYLNENAKYKVSKVYTLKMRALYLKGLPQENSFKGVNQAYSYKIISYMAKNHFTNLNQPGKKQLATMGYPDGEDLLKQSESIKNPGFPYSFENGYKVMYADNNLLSVENFIEEYNGAPHEYSQVTYENYNMNNGELVTLDNILVKGGKYYLDSIGEECFRQQQGLGPDADLRATGYIFKRNVFHANANFYFTINGLCFVFNKFEIAPYSAGLIKVLIPYHALAPIIRQDGPLGMYHKP